MRTLAFLLVFALTAGRPAAAAQELKVGGTGAALGTIQLLAKKFSLANHDLRVATVTNLGSAGAIKAVSAGALDLGVTSRQLAESESKLEVRQLEYARTPFVFVVSTKSAVTSITRRELADIYAGRMEKWPDGSAVRLVLRPASDVDTAIVRGLNAEIAQGLSVAEQRPGVQFAITDQDAANDTERVPGAIGPSTLALIVSERRALRALKLDGVEPTPANAASGAYPLYKKLFFVIGARPSPAAERFMAFVRSPAGRKILIDNGHWVP